MANSRRASKGFAIGNLHVPITHGTNNGTLGRGSPKINERPESGGIRFRFVLKLIIMARDQLWTSGALPVDGLGVQLRGFRKSHHLILAGPKVLEGVRGIAVGSDASGACRSPRAY